MWGVDLERVNFLGRERISSFLLTTRESPHRRKRGEYCKPICNLCASSISGSYVIMIDDREDLKIFTHAHRNAYPPSLNDSLVRDIPSTKQRPKIANWQSTNKGATREPFPRNSKNPIKRPLKATSGGMDIKKLSWK